MKSIEDIDQEIEWLEEEISQDEFVLGTSDASQHHRDRLAENKEKLSELLDIKKTR